MKNEEMSGLKFGMYIIIGIVIIVSILIVVIGSWYAVPSGHRGVMVTMGEVDLIEKPEGFGIKMPLIQSVKYVEVRTKRTDISTTAGSKDLQDVTSKITLNYKVLPDYCSDLYQNVGIDYEKRVITPAIEEIVKKITAQFTAEECITKRNEVRQMIENQLALRLEKHYINVVDVAITDFSFSDEFDKAIEQKVTAEQLKLKAINDLERIKFEKEQKIAQAEAEAESIRIQTQALAQSRDVLELRWIEKWDGKMPLVYGNSGNIMDITSLLNNAQVNTIEE